MIFMSLIVAFNLDNYAILATDEGVLLTYVVFIRPAKKKAIKHVYLPHNLFYLFKNRFCFFKLNSFLVMTK